MSKAPLALNLALRPETRRNAHHKKTVSQKIVDWLYNFIYCSRPCAAGGGRAGAGKHIHLFMGRTSDAREKLLAVAFDLIYENSYGSVSVDHICRRAKVNKGSFYYYFKTKTDLVVAAYEEHWLEKLSEYEHIFAKEVPPLKRLSLWCQYLRRIQEERRKRYGCACGCPYTSLGGELATQ